MNLNNCTQNNCENASNRIVMNFCPFSCRNVILHLQLWLSSARMRRFCRNGWKPYLPPPITHPLPRQKQTMAATVWREPPPHTLLPDRKKSRLQSTTAAPRQDWAPSRHWTRKTKSMTNRIATSVLVHAWRKNNLLSAYFNLLQLHNYHYFVIVLM